MSLASLCAVVSSVTQFGCRRNILKRETPRRNSACRTWSTPRLLPSAWAARCPPIIAMFALQLPAFRGWQISEGNLCAHRYQWRYAHPFTLRESSAGALLDEHVFGTSCKTGRLSCPKARTEIEARRHGASQEKPSPCACSDSSTPLERSTCNTGPVLCARH